MASSSVTYVAKQSPTAAQVNGWAQGTLGYAQVTANQGSITTAVDLTSLTVTATIVAGRRIRITGFVTFESSVADDTAELRIMEGATQLARADTICRPANVGSHVVCIAVVQPTAASHTYKLSALRAVGTGNVQMDASATAPAFLLVEDVGAT